MTIDSLHLTLAGVIAFILVFAWRQIVSGLLLIAIAIVCALTLIVLAVYAAGCAAVRKVWG